MAPDGDLQTAILKKTPGLTNLFHNNVRRSRSLASLNKMSPEDFRTNSPMGIHIEEPSSADRRPPLKMTKTSVSPDEMKMGGKKWIITPLVSPPAIPNLSRTPSPPSRPKPAPRLWSGEDSTSDSKPSLYGLETTIAPNPPSRQRSPFAMNPPMTATTPKFNTSPRTPRTNSPPFINSPRAGSPATTRQVHRPRKESLSQRRNNSIAELIIDPMKTVHERNNSNMLYQVSQGPRMGSDQSPEQSISGKEHLTPRPSDIQAKMENGSDNMITPTPPDLRRASSMLLPIALAPLLIPGPGSPPELLPSTTYGLKSPDEEKPPVPPKSPRTLFRAVPSRHPTPAAGTSTWAPSHTASSSISTTASSYSTSTSHPTSQNTSNSSFTQMSPVELPAPWVPWGSPKEKEGVEAPQESSSAPAVATSPLPWTMKERNEKTLEQPTSETPTHTRGNASVDTTVTDNSTASSLHSRNTSESSVINRGRPMKRSDTALKRVVSRGAKQTLDELPEGYSKAQAISTLSREELLSLRQDAETQASEFQTLVEGDVRDLTKESALLEEHCTELRRNALSLREERQALHRRLIAYLRAPGNALVSREHVVKQDSALADIDAAIDEATTKLEAVQERRAIVQRKLLEHLSAVLAIRVPGAASNASEEQTPPRSPVVGANMQGQLERLQLEQQLQQEAAELDSMEKLQQERQEQEQRQEQEEREEQEKRVQQEQREEQLQQAREQQQAHARRKQEAARQALQQHQFLQPVAMGKTMSKEISRADVESIRIYADSGVASLLASIEQEIDAMDRLRRN